MPDNRTLGEEVAALRASVEAGFSHVAARLDVVVTQTTATASRVNFTEQAIAVQTTRLDRLDRDSQANRDGLFGVRNQITDAKIELLAKLGRIRSATQWGVKEVAVLIGGTVGVTVAALKLFKVLP